MRGAARTLRGMNTPFSLARLGLDMIEKVLRMIVFIALPLAVIYILDELGIVFPSFVWLRVIICVGIIWTLEIYLEQMSVSILYLWL